MTRKKVGALVHALALPTLPDGGNAPCDIIASWGMTVFEDIARRTPVWSSAATVRTGPQRTPDMLRGDEIEDEHIHWLWKDRVLFKGLTGLEGNPGDGKTWIALCLAAAGSRGFEPYTKKRTTPYGTVYLSIECRPSVALRRFKRMGGDPKKLTVLRGALNADGSQSGITLDDIPLIETAILKTKARLFVIDPWQSFVGAQVDTHRANETRPILDNLSRMAERLDIAIVVVRHLAKGSGNRAIHRGLGSIDITGAMRSVLQVGTDPDDRENRALVHVKSNDGPFAESLRFAIEGKDTNARLVWKGISQLTAADLAAPEGAHRKTKVDMAGDYLFDALKSGQLPMKKLLAEGPYDTRTLQRAAQRIGVLRSGHGGKEGAWIWELPELKFTRKEEQEDDN